MQPAPRLVIAAALGLALPAWLAAQTTWSVGDAGELITAVQGYAAGDTISFTADITLWDAVPALDKNVIINGNGHTLSGFYVSAPIQRGFTIYGGQVAINDLVIAQTVAHGGDGGLGAGGGGGGLGAGGALFIKTGAQVTLSNVTLSNNSATGGEGWFAHAPHDAYTAFGGGGGGGLGGGYAGDNLTGAAAAGGGDVNGQGGSTAVNGPGNAGFGGGGQGSQTVDGYEYFGGSGGFGGGGGGGSAVLAGTPAGVGGIGGYGGGGGSGTANGAAPGPGGFAGSDGTATQGGAGASLGGAIFLMEGATLNVTGNLSQSGGAVGTSEGQKAAGSAMFLQGNGTLNFAPAAGKVVTIAGQIADETSTGFPVVAGTAQSVGGGTGVWGLTKSDAGTLVLGGDNIFTGATTVSAGQLTLNGSTMSATTIGTGATLGGSGTFHALATIESGGTLAPGNSPGTLTFTDGLTLNDGTVLDFQLGHPDSDLVLVTGGTLTGPASAAGATFYFSDAGGFTAGTYTLIDGTGAVLDGFDATKFTGGGIAGYSFVFSLTGNELSVTATAIPEPATYTALAGLLALGLAVVRRRRA